VPQKQCAILKLKIPKIQSKSYFYKVTSIYHLAKAFQIFYTKMRGKLWKKVKRLSVNANGVMEIQTTRFWQ
jgi:hypothetical protein